MVIIEAFKNELLIEKGTFSIEEYYDGNIPLIDSPEYKSSKQINKVIISIYADDDNTFLESKAEVLSDETGNFLSDRVLF